MRAVAIALLLGAGLSTSGAREVIDAYEPATLLSAHSRGGASDDATFELRFSAGGRAFGYVLDQASPAAPYANVRVNWANGSMTLPPPRSRVYGAILPDGCWVSAVVSASGAVRAVIRDGEDDDLLILDPAELYDGPGGALGAASAARSRVTGVPEMVLHRRSKRPSSGGNGGCSPERLLLADDDDGAANAGDAGRSGAGRRAGSERAGGGTQPEARPHGGRALRDDSRPTHADGSAGSSAPAKHAPSHAPSHVHSDAQTHAQSDAQSQSQSHAPAHTHAHARSARALQEQFGGRLPSCAPDLRIVELSILVDRGYTASVLRMCSEQQCDAYAAVYQHVAFLIHTTNMRFVEQLGVQIVLKHLVINVDETPSFEQGGPNYAPGYAADGRVLANTCVGARDLEETVATVYREPWEASKKLVGEVQHVEFATGYRAHLGTFSNWASRLAPSSDLWHMLTDCYGGASTDGIIGFAYIGTGCLLRGLEYEFYDSNTTFDAADANHRVRLANGHGGIATRARRDCTAGHNYCAFGTSFSSIPTFGWELFAHELGHNLGAGHAPRGLMEPFLPPSLDRWGEGTTDARRDSSADQPFSDARTDGGSGGGGGQGGAEQAPLNVRSSATVVPDADVSQDMPYILAGVFGCFAALGLLILGVFAHRRWPSVFAGRKAGAAAHIGRGALGNRARIARGQPVYIFARAPPSRGRTFWGPAVAAAAPRTPRLRAWSDSFV